jgi:hypothetical protein
MKNIGSCAKANHAEARGRSKISVGNNVCRKGESYES